ncbi:MAG TPA: radical SAM protein [Bryobacteraceae bacterium]|nr:radical SAM protein [Bryobacteraceae bacterium]
MLYQLSAIASHNRTTANRSVPMYVQVEVTSRCNLKCRMCPLTLGATGSGADGGKLADADWEQVKRMSRAAGRALVVGFGEPLTHPRFVPMLHELDELGVEISFSTNGIGAEAVAGDFATLKNLRHVNISIDSPDPEIYREIRGGDVSRALQGMTAIAAAMPDRVDVSVNSVVMKSNVRSLLQFPAILERAGVPFFSLNGLHDYTEELRQEHIFSGRSLQTFLPSRRLHVVLDQLKAECESHGIKLLLTRRTQLDFYRPDLAALEYFTVDPNKPVSRACTVPFDSMYVDSNGKVFPCCQAAGSEPLGDLRLETAEQIWHGEAFAKFRNDLLQPETTPKICRPCSAAPIGEHPFRLYRAEMGSVRTSPEDSSIHFEVRNTGTLTWDRDNPLRVGSTRPIDRESAHYHPSWQSRNRVAEMAEDVVLPGQKATISFQMTPAHVNGPETFQLLVEGHFWLPDTQFDLPQLDAGPISLSMDPDHIPSRGGSVELGIDTADGVPWEAAADREWIAPRHLSGTGTRRHAILVLPNWAREPRTSTVHAGAAKLVIRQTASERSAERMALFLTWHLLGRLVDPVELQDYAQCEGDSHALVTRMASSQEFQSRFRIDPNNPAPIVEQVVAALFSAILDQNKRAARVVALTRDLEPGDISSAVARFLALQSVRSSLARVTD